MHLNILMAGIDFHTATIDQRQAFSFAAEDLPRIYTSLLQNCDVIGAVLLVTCNRTEIYLSCKDGSSPNPASLLCAAAGMDYNLCRHLFCPREQDECFRYLCMLGCGALSQIWGEDQIITQVKTAIKCARENHAADSILEVFFRNAITAAKKIKTDIKFVRAQPSVAAQALDVLKNCAHKPKNILVIGNGEIGRMAACALIAQGFCVTMTLRRYKYTSVLLPLGAKSIDYADRYAFMHEFDAIISATSSPHCTVELADFQKISPRPCVLIDLAVPRDIDTNIAQLPDVSIYDVDTLCAGEIKENHDNQLQDAGKIIEKYQRDFIKWSKYRAVSVAD